MAADGYRELGEAAWAWVTGQVRRDDGPWLPEDVPGDGPPAGPGPDRDSLYAGIAAFLLRMARVVEHGLTAPVVDRPDQWWAVPVQLRAVGPPRPAPGSG